MTDVEMTPPPWADYPRTAADMIENAMGLLSCVMDLARASEPCPGWLEAAEKWSSRYHDWIKRHPESACTICGNNFTAWSAPSPLWNEVMRRGDIRNEDLYRGIVCVTCFTALAKQIASQWRLTAMVVNRPLQTVTPDGRVWNDEAFLFEPKANDAT